MWKKLVTLKTSAHIMFSSYYVHPCSGRYWVLVTKLTNQSFCARNHTNRTIKRILISVSVLIENWLFLINIPFTHSIIMILILYLSLFYLPFQMYMLLFHLVSLPNFTKLYYNFCRVLQGERSIRIILLAQPFYSHAQLLTCIIKHVVYM